MEKSQKLTKEQRNLINKHYYEIEERVKNNIKRLIKNQKFARNEPDLVGCALSYIPDLTLEWDENKGSKIGYVNWVSTLCVLRYISEYRRLNKNEHSIKNYKKLIDKVKRDMSYCEIISDEDIILGLSKYVKKPKKYFYNKSGKFNHNLQEVKNIIEDKQSGYKTWELTKDAIITEAYKILQNDTDKEIYLTIIIDYLLPKAENQRFFGIKQIADKFKISRSKVFNMSKDDKVKSIVKDILITKE